MEVKSTKLWTLVVNMDKYERTRFRKYLKSPYFNSNSRLVALFDLIDQIALSLSLEYNDKIFICMSIKVYKTHV